MRNEAQKTLSALKDRRILRNPAEAFFDYWPTHSAAILWGIMYYFLHKNEVFGVYILFSGMLTVALCAAKDGKKELHRKIEAIVRRLEDSGLVETEGELNKSAADQRP